MKRAVDLVLTIGTALFWIPAIAVIALLVRARLGSPVFFRQVRSGLGCRPFVIVKFKTMRDAVGPDGRQLPDVERLTPFGRMLRRTSLDEIPELWNVLRGEMSLVGPRPLLLDYLPLYTASQSRRHEARPGITGWAQINGRNALGWDEKFELDAWYVDNQSIWLDVRILLVTVLRVINRDGISPNDQEIMPRFSGSASDDEIRPSWRAE
jgi:lipopolysaccharide/colanic/teichoic acid biosynthesis glycosyltransferase